MRSFLKVFAFVVLSLVGLWIVVGLGLRAYFLLARPESPIVDDCDLRLEESEVPEEENAYVGFLALTNALSCQAEDKSVITAYDGSCNGKNAPFKCWRKDATPEMCRTEVDRILVERAEGLAGLHRVLQMPQYCLVPDSEGLFFPPISALAWADMLLRAKAFRARENGDLETAFEAERDALRLAVFCRDHASTVVECMVGCGLSSVCYRRMMLLANDERTSEEMLVSAAELLKNDFDEKALFEKAAKHEYVNSSCLMLEKIGDKMDMDDFWNLLQDRVNAFVPGKKRKPPLGVSLLFESSAFVRFAYNKEMTRKDLADVVRAGLAGRNPEDVVPMPDSCFQPNFGGRFLARCFTPALSDLQSRLKDSLFGLRVARTVVAVQRYCRAHGGKPPSDLSALVPDYLSEVAYDPYVADRMLGYDAEQGLIWSVGERGDFNPLDEKIRSSGGFRHNATKYAVRLDGKPLDLSRLANPSLPVRKLLQ